MKIKYLLIQTPIVEKGRLKLFIPRLKFEAAKGIQLRKVFLNKFTILK